MCATPRPTPPPPCATLATIPRTPLSGGCGSRWNGTAVSTGPAPPPDPAPLAADPRFRRGLALFRAGEYFECHEVWEDVWREARPPRRLFIQSLIHLAV